MTNIQPYFQPNTYSEPHIFRTSHDQNLTCSALNVHYPWLAAVQRDVHLGSNSLFLVASPPRSPHTHTHSVLHICVWFQRTLWNPTHNTDGVASYADRVSVCVCVSVCVFICTCVCVTICFCLCGCIYVCLCLCVCVPIFLFFCVCIYMCAWVCMSVSVHVCVCVCAQEVGSVHIRLRGVCIHRHVSTA